LSISAVIPTIGKSRWLDDAINSCLQQNEPFDEVIIVDNTEGLAVRHNSVFADDPRVRWEEIEPAYLPAHENWNQSVQLCNSDHILIHGDDDILFPQFSEAAHSAIEAGYSIVFNGFTHIDEHFCYSPEQVNQQTVIPDNKISHFKEYLDTDFFLARTLGPFRLRVVGVTFSRALFEEVGGIMNSTMPREWYTDDLLWFRMASWCGRIAEVTEPTWAYRWTPDWAGNIESVDGFVNCFSDYMDLLRDNVNPASGIHRLVCLPEFVVKYRERCTAVWSQFAARS